MQELETVAAARKEEGQAVQKTRQGLKKQLQLDKAKITKLLKQTDANAADRSKAEERWKKDKNMLLAKTQELEVSLRERTHELTFAAVARREDEQTFQKDRQELEDQIANEKEKQARILNQTSGDVAEYCRERETWENDRKVLQVKLRKLEKVSDERAQQLEQTTGQRVELEARLAEIQKETARQLETVDEQIEQKTKELTKNLKTQCEREETGAVRPVGRNAGSPR